MTLVGCFLFLKDFKGLMLKQNLINFIFGKTEPKNEKKLNFENPLFGTNLKGGLCVDVISLVNSNYPRHYCKMRNSYLKDYIINDNDPSSFTGEVVLINNFGIVDGTSKIKNNRNDLSLLNVINFEFRYAKPYMMDTMGDNFRIDKIEELQPKKYEYYLPSLRNQHAGT